MKEAPIENFPSGWHRQIGKNHICIWSDEWMENYKKHIEKEKRNDPSPDNP